MVDLFLRDALSTLRAQCLPRRGVEFADVPAEREGHAVPLDAEEPGLDQLGGLTDLGESVVQRLQVEKSLQDVKGDDEWADGHGKLL